MTMSASASPTTPLSSPSASMGAGSRPPWVRRGGAASGRYRGGLGGGELEGVIDVDLSVACLTPPLHLPVMAGLAQGPGFPNLPPLRLLSDRILRRYVAVNDAGALVTERRRRA